MYSSTCIYMSNYCDDNKNSLKNYLFLKICVKSSFINILDILPVLPCFCEEFH